MTMKPFTAVIIESSDIDSSVISNPPKVHIHFFTAVDLDSASMVAETMAKKIIGDSPNWHVFPGHAVVDTTRESRLLLIVKGDVEAATLAATAHGIEVIEAIRSEQHDETRMTVAYENKDKVVHWFHQSLDTKLQPSGTLLYCREQEVS